MAVAAGGEGVSVRVIIGDCREVLAGLPAESFDCIVTDPPYGETSLPWDQRVDGWLDACRRVLKPSGSLWCFGSMRFFMDRAQDFAGWRQAQDVVWEKHNGSGFASDRFKRVHEMAVQFYPADRAWSEVFKCPQVDPSIPKIGGLVKHRGQPPHTGKIGSTGYDAARDRMMRSVIYARSCHGKAEHPTQKPVEILLPLIRYSCPPGGTVLDPFAGSGSTGIAAKIAGCHATLIEISETYADLARRRITGDAPLFAEVAR